MTVDLDVYERGRDTFIDVIAKAQRQVGAAAFRPDRLGAVVASLISVYDLVDTLKAGQSELEETVAMLNATAESLGLHERFTAPDFAGPLEMVLKPLTKRLTAGGGSAEGPDA